MTLPKQLEARLFDIYQNKQRQLPPSSLVAQLTDDVFYEGLARVYSLRANHAEHALAYAQFLRTIAPDVSLLAVARAEWAIGGALHTMYRLDEAAQRFSNLADHFTATEDFNRLITVQLNLLGVYASLDDAEQAFRLESLIRANLPKSARKNFNTLELERTIGLIYLQCGRHSEALDCIKRGFAIKDQVDHPESVASFLLNAASIYRQTGRYSEAKQLYDESLGIFEEEALAVDVARCYLGLAKIGLNQANFEAALHNLQQARDRFGTVQQPIEVAYVDHQRGVAYLALGLFEEAKTMARQAVELLKQQKLFYYAAEALTNVAQAERNLDNHDAAQKALTQARYYYKKRDAHGQLQETDFQRAELAFEVDSFQRAYRIARRLEKEVNADHAPMLAANVQLLLARCLHEMQRAHTADLALAAANQLAERYYLQDVRVACHHLRGKSAESTTPHIAHQAYRQAVTLLEERRRTFLFDEHHVGYMQRQLPIYNDFLRLSHWDALKTKRYEGLLEAIELTLSAPLLSLQTRTKSTRLTQSEQQALARLREQWRWQQNRLESRGRADGFAKEPSVVEEIDEATLLHEVRQTESAIAEILRQRRMRGGKGVGSREQGVGGGEQGSLVGRIQESLGEDVAQLVYYVVEEKLHLLVVTREAVRLFADLVAESGIERLLKAWRFHIENVAAHGDVLNPAVAQAYTRRFYAALVGKAAEILTKKSHLQIIIPPAWHALPFAAFHDGKNYLIEKYTLTYLAKPQPQSHNPVTQQGTALIVANTDAGRLTNTLQEAQTVSAMIASKFNVQTLLEETATSEKLIETSRDSSLIHLATHALFRADNPYFSWVRLQDRRVPVVDLYTTRLENAPLVVLSACETGRGKPQGGGVIGVGRGFLVAGASAVIFSLWSQSDESTPALMESFYRAWLPDEVLEVDVGRALQVAQIAAIKKRLHPFHWAGFTYLSA